MLHATVVSRENIEGRLTVPLRVERKFLDVREQRVQTALLRGHRQQYDEYREKEGRRDVWEKQRMYLRFRSYWYGCIYKIPYSIHFTISILFVIKNYRFFLIITIYVYV